MKGKMDGVARRAEGVAQRFLPERPHHLCIDAKRRFPNPTGFWYSGQSAGLQYMTYLSDADRGVLLTLPFFEIRDEPDTLKPPPNTAARGEAKKKMTFKDYQNRKKSNSPTDNDASSTKPDSQQAAATAPRESAKNEEQNSRGLTRPEKSRQEAPYEKSKNSSLAKPETNSAAAPENRKRHSDMEQASPPQKKIKTEPGAPEPNSSRATRPDQPRGRDTANGRGPHKEALSTNSQATVNGRARLGSDKDRASPASSIHVNGSLSRSRSTSSPLPPKPESTTKPAVPELLSPLRLGFADDVDMPKKSAAKTSEKAQKNSNRARSDSRTGVPDLLSPLRLGLDGNGGNSGKKPSEKGGSSRAREADNPSPLKKPKPSVEIPPLLSPTLPPLIEAELSRLKKSPADGASQGATRDSESPLNAVKARTRDDGAQEKSRSRIVVLKYKKRIARRVAAILALPSRSDKKTAKKDRSLSLERTPPPIHARKRPLPADDQPLEPSKRSKSGAEPPATKSGVPSTPLKNSTTATAMSRVTSSNSQAHTPGDTAGLTPSVADRPLTSSDNLDHASGAKAATLRQRQSEYTSRGGKLKHSKDAIIRQRGSAPLSPADEKRVAALHFEMILAYMVAFNALNQARALDRKVADLKTWETLLPHFPELKHRIRRSRPLLALAVQMHAVCLEQITQAFVTLDPTSVTLMHASWAKLEKRRVPTWTEAASLLEDIPDNSSNEGLKASIGPWTPVDDAVASALSIIRRWADREDVNWRPEVVVPMANHP